MNITKLVLGACNTNVYIVSSNKKNAILIDPADNAAEIIKTIEEKNTSTPVIITIAREYGSGGRYIGKLVAEKLGIKLYDKNIIENMAEDTGLDEEYIEENEQKRNSLDMTSKTRSSLSVSLR